MACPCEENNFFRFPDNTILTVPLVASHKTGPPNMDMEESIYFQRSMHDGNNCNIGHYLRYFPVRYNY